MLSLPALSLVAVAIAAPVAGDQPPALSESESHWPSLTAAVHSAALTPAVQPSERTCLRAALGPADSRAILHTSEQHDRIRALYDLGMNYAYESEEQLRRGDLEEGRHLDALGLAAFVRLDAAASRLDDSPVEIETIAANTLRILEAARVQGLEPSEEPPELAAVYDSNVELCLRSAQDDAPDDRWKLVRAFHLVRLRARDAPIAEDNPDVRAFEVLAQARDIGPTSERDAMWRAISGDLTTSRSRPAELADRPRIPPPATIPRASGTSRPSDRPSDRRHPIAVPLIALGAATTAGGIFQIVWGSTMQRITTREFSDPPTAPQQQYLDETIAPRKRLHWGLGSALAVTGIAALTTGLVLRARTKSRHRQRSARLAR